MVQGALRQSDGGISNGGMGESGLQPKHLASEHAKERNRTLYMTWCKCGVSKKSKGQNQMPTVGYRLTPL